MQYEDLATQLKMLSQPDLFKAIKLVTAQLEKASKVAAKPTKAKKASKKTANPNKSYDQLKKPRAWVNFVLQYSLQNGWDAFSITQAKKDRETKKVVSEEIIEMPKSECVDGVYYYKGTVDLATGKGKTMITKHAMSLSKIFKSDKPDLYEQFSSKYDEEAGNESAASSASDAEAEAEAEAKPVVVRKTASQKSREAEEKKAAKEAEKVAAKAAKDAEKATAKAEKEAAKAVKAEVKPKVESKPKAAPAATAVIKKPVTQAAAKATSDNWVAPDEDGFHDWTWGGKLYFRNSQNHVFTQSADGQCGNWMGLWIPAELRFDMIETPAEYLGEEDSIMTVQP